MNSSKLLSVLHDIRLLKFVSADELQKLADDYPYFQQAHILLAKKYLIEHKPNFEDKLHTAAIYASDRTNLRSIMAADTELKEKQEPVAATIQQAEHIQVQAAQNTIELESIYVNESELSVVSMNDMLPPKEVALEEENYDQPTNEGSFSEATAIEELEVSATQTEGVINEDELVHASMTDMLPLNDTILEEENHEALSEENTLSEATAMEELEISASQTEEAINEDELVHASMADLLPPGYSVLEEENYETVVDENTITEATAMEELEATTLRPFEEVKADELSHASLNDILSSEDINLEEENYEAVTEDNTVAEAEALEEIELAAQPAQTNGKSANQEFNINSPHTFSDWLKFIQNSPRALQHTSSAPDYHPIIVPDSLQTSTAREVIANEPHNTTLEEEIPIEYIPDILAADPTNNLLAIDEFVAEAKPVVITINESTVKQLADKSVEDNEELLTETLARIYEEQGLYNKAIRVYARLSLKFPEKSLYFAPLIKELKSKL